MGRFDLPIRLINEQIQTLEQKPEKIWMDEHNIIMMKKLVKRLEDKNDKTRSD